MWAQIINAAIGIWLMAAPAVLNYGSPASTNDRIVGPIIATAGIIAVSHVTRSVGRINIALGLWLLIAPWIFGYSNTPTVNSSVAGLILAVVAYLAPESPRQFDGGWSMLWSGQDPEGTDAAEGRRE